MNQPATTWPAIGLALLALLCLLGCLAVFTHGLLARRQAQRLKPRGRAAITNPPPESA